MDALVQLALQDPDELTAWLGPIKATSSTFKRHDAYIRWSFFWEFRKTTKLVAIEYIINHELLMLKPDHAWMGAEMQRGETFNCHLMIYKDGNVVSV